MFAPWIDRLKEFPFGLCIILERAYTCAIVLLPKEGDSSWFGGGERTPNGRTIPIFK
jgi:hypothetical protein